MFFASAPTPLPSNLNLNLALHSQRAYVVYPPEGPRPPSPDTVHSIARDNSARDAGSRK